MAYVWIFGLCYAGAFVLWLWYMMNKQAGIVRAMMRQGMPESELDAFRKEMFPKTFIVLVWSTFFTGSVVGAVIAGILALAR